jgi:hypothetical protein
MEENAPVDVGRHDLHDNIGAVQELHASKRKRRRRRMRKASVVVTLSIMYVARKPTSE